LLLKVVSERKMRRTEKKDVHKKEEEMLAWRGKKHTRRRIYIIARGKEMSWAKKKRKERERRKTTRRERREWTQRPEKEEGERETDYGQNSSSKSKSPSSLPGLFKEKNRLPS